MKKTNIYPTEWTFDCPHCMGIAGSFDTLDDEIFDEIQKCNICHKKIKVKKPIWYRLKWDA